MTIQDSDYASRKETELAAGIPYLPRARERIAIVCGIGLGIAVGGALYYFPKYDKDTFGQMKRSLYLYDILVCGMILTTEFYSLSYYHEKLIPCFPVACVPKCVIKDWIKIIWYILLCSPNFIWGRKSIHALILMGLIGGIGVVYFIHLLVESAYINPKLAEYAGKLDYVGMQAKLPPKEDDGGGDGGDDDGGGGGDDHGDD